MGSLDSGVNLSRTIRSLLLDIVGELPADTLL